MRVIMWVPEQWQGAEYLALHEQEGVIVAESTVIGVLGGQPLCLRYRIELNTDWQVRHLSITSADRQLLLWRSSTDSVWTDADGTVMSELMGCTDVDIEITPFTNSLPIKRLALQSGESAEVKVVYISIPDLGVRAARQRYTNIGGGHYQYEAVASGFKAVISVDRDGFVLQYPGLFRQLPRDCSQDSMEPGIFQDS